VRVVLGVLSLLVAALLVTTLLFWVDTPDGGAPGPDEVAPPLPPPSVSSSAPTATPTATPAATPTATPAATPTATPDEDVPFEQQPGVAIAQAGSSAMGSLTSLHYRLSVRGVPGHGRFAVDVRAADSGSCTGSIAIDDGRVEIRGVGGEQWFKADEAAWRAAEPDRADAFIAAADDHWVRDEGFEYANFCFFANVLGELLQDVGTGTWFAIGSDRSDGHDVIRVQGSSDGAVVVAAVRLDEPHYLASFQRTNDSDGSVATSRFSEFGVDGRAELREP